MGKSEIFQDFNFKLVVIDALLDKEPLFLKELKDLIEKYTNKFEWYSGAGPIVEIRGFLEELTLEISDLEKIDSLCFDGGMKFIIS